MVSRCYFLAFLGVDTHLFRALWNDLRLPSVRFAFQEEKATASSQHSAYQGREDRSLITADEMSINVYIRKSKLVWKDSQAVLISGEVEMKDQS